ncbi:lanthionine synthetase C family protein [Streptomyces sp. NPDC000941]
MTTTNSPATAADTFARHLTSPTPPPEDQPWTAQSLAVGAAGTALLHIERARTGRGTWQQAHAWIKSAVAADVSAADTSGLYLGAPAVAFMLSCAITADSARYHDTLATMDQHVTDLAHRRADATDTRLCSGRRPTFHEYDVFYGMTGIGAHLLRRAPAGNAMERILSYLVTLTRPTLDHDNGELPGWWVSHDPHLTQSRQFPGGHANLGAAHGITGPLLLLARALRQGVTVDGHQDAIDTILGWLDAWRQDGPSGPWWPEHLHLGDLQAGVPSQTGPARPSWCYGTPGIARAGQLAAIARHDATRQHLYEEAMARCLTDSNLSTIVDTGLCHGWAGIYQTAWRAAHDAAAPTLRAALLDLAAALTRHAQSGPDPGLLQGDAGTALALTTAAHDAAPTSGWDACLLID